MKNRLIILIITVCIVFQLARLEGYGYVRTREGFKTTAQREAEEHVADVTDNARLTEYQEEREHHGGDVTHAEVTQAIEKAQHRNSVERNVLFTDPEQKYEWRGGKDHARLTNAQEQREHIADVSNNARFTSQDERGNRYRSELNSSTTAAVEKDSRQPQ
jgi:hypothetical protein